MKQKTIAILSLIVFLFLVVYFVSKTGFHLADPVFFRIDSTLFFIIAFSVAFGAAAVLLLLSLFPIRLPSNFKTRTPEPAKTTSLGETAFSREAQIAAQLGDWVGAEALWKQVPVDDADYWMARKSMGDIAFENGEWFAAENEYQESLRTAPPKEDL